MGVIVVVVVGVVLAVGVGVVAVGVVVAVVVAVGAVVAAVVAVVVVVVVVATAKFSCNAEYTQKHKAGLRRDSKSRWSVSVSCHTTGWLFSPH